MLYLAVAVFLPSPLEASRSPEDVMTGQAHWFPILLLVGTSLVIYAIWRALRRIDRGLRPVRTEFTCPATGRTVQVVAVQERATGYFTGIRECDAFQRQDDVRCSQTCVKALNVEAAAKHAPLPAPGR